MRTSPFHRFPPLPILFLAVFVDMVGFGIVVPVLPLYTSRFGASPITIGALLAVYSGMGFIFAPLVGLLADRFGRRKILLLRGCLKSPDSVIFTGYVPPFHPPSSWDKP